LLKCEPVSVPVPLMMCAAAMLRRARLGIGCTAVALSAVVVQRLLMKAAPSSMSPAAAIQYLLDMRHTALGARWARRGPPPLTTGELHGKLVLVTGGTGGIGLAAARYLARAGAEVHITGRSQQRGAAAVASTGAMDGSIVFHQADLGSVSGARAFAETFAVGPLKGRHLDILVQNLASMHDKYGRNDDGHERTLGTNILNFYVLAKKFAPYLSSDGRMINVVSAGQHLFRLRRENLEALNTKDADFDGVRAYSLTHRARVLLSKRWARSPALASAVASVHPGWVETSGLREATPMASWYAVMKLFLRDEDEGADTVAWLASPSTPLTSGALNGGYFWDRQCRSIDLPLAGTAASEEEVDHIIAWLEKMTK